MMGKKIGESKGTIVVRIPVELDVWLRDEALRRKIFMSDLVAEALRHMKEDHDDQADDEAGAAPVGTPEASSSEV